MPSEGAWCIPFLVRVEDEEISSELAPAMESREYDTEAVKAVLDG